MTGTYRWNGTRDREKCTHCAIASRLLTDSPVSTSMTPASFRLLISTRSGYNTSAPILTGVALLVADVHRDFELSLVLLLEVPNEAVVLELFPDGPDKDGGHEASGC